MNKNNVVSVDDIFTGKAIIGESIVIIGGGTTGCEAAHYLTDKG
jgi:pyruvate/2-oxoglutarate dehydrogenase complex dihydrolipoamide dehydrogenase (E3) component